MSLLDTYIKLQAINQQRQAQQAQELHSILYLADAIQKMKGVQQEEAANQALATVSPYTTTEIPQQGMTGMEEYDVLKPGTGEITTGLKPDEQYFRESFEAVKPHGMKYALPFLTAQRGAMKEKEAERIRREENPLVPFEFNGQKGTAALSNVAPIVAKHESLTQSAYDKEQDRITRKQIADDSIATKRLIAEIAKGNQSPFDKTIVTKTLTELPKLKADATTQKNNIERIDRALELVNKGVTGKGGQVKAFLAPYAEMLGVKTEGLTDAQTFQLLTRVIVGPMRLDIVGPGPVSEWEQKLMQQISGGGGAAKEAANELLNAYKKQAHGKISNYNDTLNGITQLAPNIGKVYQSINIPVQAATPTQPQPTFDLNAIQQELKRRKSGGK